MSERHVHCRDDEGNLIVHRREDDFSMPNMVRWAATFINRVGFPIFAFCVLAYFYFVGLQKNTKVIGELRDVMMAVKMSLDDRK